MKLMTPIVMKHTVIIPTVVDSGNPVDEKIHDFIQENLNAWSQVGHTHIGSSQKLMRRKQSLKNLYC